MYKIGEFSKMTGLSVKTLRYYDECGILKPKTVDIFTGYRYYTDENLVECSYIKLLKDVNFTLDEISKYKDDLTEDAIKTKKEEIKTSIRELIDKYSQLNKMLEDVQRKEE